MMKLMMMRRLVDGGLVSFLLVSYVADNKKILSMAILAGDLPAC